MPILSLHAPPEPVALEAMWRALEARSEISFFQSWTWTGCLYAERFTRPLLLRATRDDEIVALALFNQRLLSRHLGESGAPEMDSIYIEYNGLLRVRDNPPDLGALLRGARLPGWPPRRIVLSGVDDTHLAAARIMGGRVKIRRTHILPALDFSTHGVDWMAGISANTRQQLRRSTRAYAARGGLRIERAANVDQAHAYLDALAALHQRTWTVRGQPGAFARPFFQRFHRELISRGVPREEVDLLRISAGDEDVGYLYNFRHRTRVLAYQSGFDYAGAGGACKPGLTCHQMAMDMYAACGAQAYDFLAGDDQYKRSLANTYSNLHWLVIDPPFSALWGR